MKALAARPAPDGGMPLRVQVGAAVAVAAAEERETVAPGAVAEERPTAQPPAPRVKRHAGSGRRVRLLREVVDEVEALRGVLQEAVRQYELRTAAQLAEILRVLYGESGSLTRLPSAKTTSAMLHAIRSAELKPARGRARDLVRLRELVAELTELLTPQC